MRYTHTQMEEQAVLATAANMCAAARTAPKGKGFDNIYTLVLTGAEKDALAAKMHEVADREFGDKPIFFRRDAENLKAAQAVVLIGTKRVYAGLPFCSFCGFENCAACKEAGAWCAFPMLDLGIALGSAAAVATDSRVDNRIMFSAGKVAAEMGYMEGDMRFHAIPLSVSAKNVFFDRKS
ncbi:DUF2148 domain-containing protein [Christensenellaceae bacterium OttesenSCG-928-L17]|nr:DUF2148 domain-containing protein [Christensenellaceae bacterium OttesenSCG-928-L17]